MTTNSKDFTCGVVGLAVGGVLSLMLSKYFRRIYSVGRYITKHGAIEPMKMVLVARSDLRMSSGKLSAQCAHAAVACYAAALKYDPHSADLWESTGQAKIVVRANDEMELHKLAEKAKNSKLVVALIRDAGRTQLAINTPTVLGIGPGKVSVIDEVSGHLRLF